MCNKIVTNIGDERLTNQIAIFHNFPKGVIVGYSGSHEQFEDAIRICQQECNTLVTKDRAYGASWKKRPRGVFHMLARKWDRIETYVEQQYEDEIFEAIKGDKREEGILDDIKDLRNYLLLILLEAQQREDKHKRLKED